MRYTFGNVPASQCGTAPNAGTFQRLRQVKKPISTMPPPSKVHESGSGIAVSESWNISEHAPTSGEPQGECAPTAG